MKNNLLPYEKKKLIMLSLGIFLILGSLLFICYSIKTNYLSTFTKESLSSLTSTIAIFAVMSFMIAFSLFITRILLKFLTHTLNKIQLNIYKEKTNDSLVNKFLYNIKKFLVILSKILQKLHIIFALIGVSAIMVHVYIGVYIGFNLILYYILAIATLTSMILTCIFGIVKIFNSKFYLHIFLSIIFIVLFILHALA